MFRKFNINPNGDNIDDCYIRATSFATGIPYEEMEQLLEEEGVRIGYPANDLRTIASYLMVRGWNLYQFDKDSRPTVKKFCELHSEGWYLPVCANHITVVLDGDVYDTWNCHRNRVRWYFTRNED